MTKPPDNGPALDRIAERVEQISARNERLLERMIEGEKRFRGLAKSVWKVQEGDVSGSANTDITGLDPAAGTTGDGRIPQDDDDDKIFGFMIDLKGRKRYINLDATAGNGALGTYMAALAILSRAEESANTTTERGLAGIKRLPAP